MSVKKLKSVLSTIIISIIFIVMSNVYEDSEGDKNNSNNFVGASEVEVHFLDVGQGDSILIFDSTEDISILIDGGDRKSGDDIVKFLNSKNIDEIDYVVATHPHADHIGGLIQVLETFKVDNVLMPEIEHTSKTYEDFINSILNNTADTEVIYARSGLTFKEGYFNIEVLAPFNNTDDLNNNSVVVKLSYGDYGFLFTGDIEEEVETEILNSGFNVDVDFLKVAHHGSSTSNSEQFIKKVSPTVSVIQLGVDNDYGHPHEEAMSILQKYSKEIYRTDLNGTVSLYFDNGEYTLTTEK